MSVNVWNYQSQSLTSLINRIGHFVRTVGINTNQAKSSWGADVYEHKGVITKLCDDGSTWMIISDGLKVSQTMDFEPQFTLGNYEVLGAVFRDLMSHTDAGSNPSLCITVKEFSGTDLDVPEFAKIKLQRKHAIAIFDAYSTIQQTAFKRFSISVPLAEYFTGDKPHHEEFMQSDVIVQKNSDTPDLFVESCFTNVMEEIESNFTAPAIRDLVLTAPDIELTPALLEARYTSLHQGSFPEHPKYKFESWAYDASNCDTKVGYWAWVSQEIKSEAE